MELEKPSRNLIRWNVVLVISGFLLFGLVFLLDYRGIRINMVLLLGVVAVVFLLSVVIVWLNTKYLFGRLLGANKKPRA